jgi:hypothetical protein
MAFSSGLGLLVVIAMLQGCVGIHVLFPIFPKHRSLFTQSRNPYVETRAALSMAKQFNEHSQLICALYGNRTSKFSGNAGLGANSNGAGLPKFIAF